METMRSVSEEEESSATFVIRVNRKPGEAWHGDVSWVTGSGRQKFDNVQELFNLMNVTLNHAGKA